MQTRQANNPDIILAPWLTTSFSTPRTAQP